MECSQPGPGARLEQKEGRAESLRAFGNLPGPLKKVVYLVFFEGHNYSEAAELLSIPLGTVKSRMHTAKARLRQSSLRSSKCVV